MRAHAARLLPTVDCVVRAARARSWRVQALAEKESLRVAWREQTEEWFRSAASEMQDKLLADWGSASGLQQELALSKQERARADAAHAVVLEAAQTAEGGYRAEASTLGAEKEGLQAELAEVRTRLDHARTQLKAAQHAGQQLLAKAEVREAQLAELQATDATRREREEAEAAERLERKAELGQAQRERDAIEATLAERDREVSMLRAVNERVRMETSEEHGRLLEAHAKLEQLEKSHATLARQNSVLLRSAEAVAG